MIIDIEKNEYHQIVKNNLTGKITHKENIPLEQHNKKQINDKITK